jgi:hypothetical protein
MHVHQQNIPNMEISTTSDSPIYHRDNNDQGKLEAKNDMQDDEIDFLQQISQLNDVEEAEDEEDDNDEQEQQYYFSDR